MRLIDNRYKVDKVIEDGLNNAIYQVTDFWDNDKKQFMKLYNYEKRKEVINYFINNFIYLSKIRHEYLLASDQFSLVKTIDRKKVNVLQYYSTVEYVNSPSLSQFTKELTFKERLNIVLDVIKIIDFLHYRGIVYRHLSPSNLFLLEDGTIKLKDLATIFEKIINTDYDDLTRYFLAPEVLLNQEEIDKRADYYSIGMLMKYLFLEDFLVDKVDAFIYYSEDELSPDQEVFLNEIIKNLTKKNSLARDVNLGQLMEDINLKFHMEYPYNLMEERNNLYFKTKIVGRQKEIERILELDKELVAGTLIHRGIIINGSSGMGKTRFLKEISHQLKIRGRDVYLTEIDENDGIDLMAMANILRQSMKDTPQELMEKYGKELAKILPDLRFTIGEPTNTDLSQYKEKLRLFDRITNYFEELSKDKIIYIAIDDLQNCNSNFLMLLNYLINNIKSKQVFFILSFKDESSVKNTIIKEKIVEWKLNKNVLEVSLLKLNLEEIGEMIQYILGISYRPIKFASVLLKESQGNPRYIEYSMKDLHNRKELYLNKNGMWDIKTDNYSNIYFSTDINEALKKQLNLIKTDYFEIFKVMSIFNSSLSKKTLVRMLNISPKRLEEDLERLITLRLIDERVADWGYSYSIYNSQLKKLIYHEISEEEKSRLHKSAAKVIEDTYGEQLKFVMEELIYHLLNSNQPMKALEIILKEVKKIDNQYSSNSVFLWEKAYGIINDNSDEVKLQVLDNLVNIYSLRGDVEKTNKYLKELTIEAEKLSNLYYIIRSRTLRADYYYKKNQIDLAQRETRDIERISKEHNFVEGMISALIIKSRIGLNIKTLDYVTEKLNEALELSKVSGVHAYLGTIYNIWGITCYLKGNMGESIEKYEKSITFFQNNGNYLESTKPMNNIGNIYAQHYGDREKAMEFYKKGLDIATQYGFLESEIVFLNNMGEIYIRHREYGKAMEYIEAARKGALEVEDVNLVFLTNINLGLVNLLIGEYSKAYNYYVILKEEHEKNEILDIEIKAQYCNFLGEFHGVFGQWDLAIEYSKQTGEICREFNTREFLTSQFRIICIKYFKDSIYDKETMEKIRVEHRNRTLNYDRRKIILYFSIISLLEKDYEYTLNLLEEDLELKNDCETKYFKYIREMIICNLNDRDSNITNMVKIEEKIKSYNLLNIDLIVNMIIGFKFYEKGLYYQAINYLLETLDIMYRLAMKIPERELQISYIDSRGGNLVKEKLSMAIENAFNKKVECKYLTDIKGADIEEYFDFRLFFDLISNEEFTKIAEINYFYHEASNVYNIETLIARLTEDYRYNLDLIIRYLAKETLAQKGCILIYDEESNKYLPISSLDDNLNWMPNENILALSNRSNKGILINNSPNEFANNFYKEFLSKEIKGLICVPITIPEKIEDRIKSDRRKDDLFIDKKNEGYIYLETDRVFNRFDSDRFKLVNILSYLVFINIENYMLKAISTTDKLTNTYTRKYFESKFEEIITYSKKGKNNFTLLMLDIDKFKNINDTYGHRKGDEVLSCIGRKLVGCIRTTDLAARYGGEEFIVLLKNTTENEGKLVGEKIRSNIESLKISGLDYPITVSIGISVFPKHSQFKEELIEKADQALYYAKDKGRNRIVVWNNEIGNTLNRVDRLAGILSGNTNEDNRNILALLDVTELIKEKKSKEEKIFIFLNRLIETVDAEYSNLIELENKSSLTKIYSRVRLNNQWINTPFLNYTIINKTIVKKKGEFLIDWDNVDDVDRISGVPNWQSIIVIPLIVNEEVKGVVYLSVPLKEKEFDYNSYNLTRTLSNIFAAIIS